MEIALTILAVALWVVLGTIVLALLVMSIPLSIRVRGALPDDVFESGIEAKAAWGGVLLRFGLALSASKSEVRVALFGVRIWRRDPIKLALDRGRKERRKKKEKKVPAKREKHKAEAPFVEVAETVRRFRRSLSLPHMRDAAAEAVAALRISGRLEGRLGFSEPSSTAVAAGLLGAMGATAPKVGMRLELDYLDEVCDLRGEVTMGIWVPRVAFYAARFFLGRKGRAMIRHWRSAKSGRAVAV